MIVGALELSLRLEGCRSLKDKRQVVRSLIDRLRHDLKISVAEVGDQSLWNSCVLGLACAGENRAVVEKVLRQALQIAERDPLVEVVSGEPILLDA